MIRKTLFMLAFAVLAPSLALAEPAKPETIEELLVVMKSQSLIESTLKNIDDSMTANLNQALAQIPGDADEKRAYVDSFSGKMAKITREELNWEMLKSMFVRIYGDSFSQEELVGLVDMYKTPAGQTLVNKMPLVMQKTMAEMQQRMGPMMQKVGAAAQETLNEAKARQAAKQAPADEAAKKPASK